MARFVNATPSLLSTTIIESGLISKPHIIIDRATLG